jgi:hypothetical protein
MKKAIKQVFFLPIFPIKLAISIYTLVMIIRCSGISEININHQLYGEAIDEAKGKEIHQLFLKWFPVPARILISCMGWVLIIKTLL